MLPGHVDVVAEGGAALQSQGRGQHLEDHLHGAPFLQRLIQRLEVDAAGDEVGEQKEEVETVQP